VVPRIRSLSPAPSTQRGFDPANITAADRQHFYHDLDRWGARTPRNEAFNWGVLACQSIHIIRRSDGELTTDDLKNMEQNKTWSAATSPSTMPK